MRMKADIFLHDECPRIGCGWRRCALVVGPKYVKITAHGRSQRLPRWQLVKMPNGALRKVDQLDVLKPRRV